jgi:hypothetical protein
VSPNYAFFAHLAQTWGLVYFVVIFIAVGLRTVAVAPEAIRRIRARAAAGGLI